MVLIDSYATNDSTGRQKIRETTFHEHLVNDSPHKSVFSTKFLASRSNILPTISGATKYTVGMIKMLVLFAKIAFFVANETSTFFHEIGSPVSRFPSYFYGGLFYGMLAAY